jgi:hypothetical protein
MTTPPVVSVTDELIAELEAVAHTGKGAFMSECAEVHALLAERAELKRDAERYRWLRDDNAYFPEEEGVRGGQELDASIDAAMQP